MQKSVLLSVLFASVLLMTPRLTQAFTLYPIPYSGQLSESGVPVNGTRWISLQIYAVATGGSPLLVQAESLQVVGGVYHTEIATPSSLWPGGDRWLGVSVNSGAELTPRVHIGMVPYAIKTLLSDSTLQVQTGAAGNNFVFNAPVTSTAWVLAQSMFLTAPEAGYVVVNACGVIEGLTGSVGYLGELFMGTAAPSVSPPDSYPFSSGLPSSGWAGTGPDMPLTYAKMVPVVAGGNSIFVYARKRTAGSGDFEFRTVAITGMYFRKNLGP